MQACCWSERLSSELSQRIVCNSLAVVHVAERLTVPRDSNNSASFCKSRHRHNSQRQVELCNPETKLWQSYGKKASSSYGKTTTQDHRSPLLFSSIIGTPFTEYLNTSFFEKSYFFQFNQIRVYIKIILHPKKFNSSLSSFLSLMAQRLFIFAHRLFISRSRLLNKPDESACSGLQMKNGSGGDVKLTGHSVRS